MIASIIVFVVIPQGGKTTQAWSTRAQLKRFIGKLRGYKPWLQLLLFLGASLFPSVSDFFSDGAWILDIIDLLERFANKIDFGGKTPKSISSSYCFIVCFLFPNRSLDSEQISFDCLVYDFR